MNVLEGIKSISVPLCCWLMPELALLFLDIFDGNEKDRRIDSIENRDISSE